MWPSPNGMIRNALNGTQFRESIIFKNIKKYVPGWKKPIVMARHTFGDQYGGKDVTVIKPSTISMNLSSTDQEESFKVFDFKGKGVALLLFNTEDSIKSFAKSCFRTALDRKLPLYFATKSTIVKNYDKLFDQVFLQVYER